MTNIAGGEAECYIVLRPIALVFVRELITFTNLRATMKHSTFPNLSTEQLYYQCFPVFPTVYCLVHQYKR